MFVKVKLHALHAIEKYYVCKTSWARRQIFLLLWRKLMATKLLVFPSGSHHLFLPVITSIVRAYVLDWTLACCKNSHISWDHNIFTVNVVWGRLIYSFTFKQKQHIMPRDQIFGPSNAIEQKHVCFFRSYPSIIVISRVFKHGITEILSATYMRIYCSSTKIRLIAHSNY